MAPVSCTMLWVPVVLPSHPSQPLKARTRIPAREGGGEALLLPARGEVSRRGSRAGAGRPPSAWRERRRKSSAWRRERRVKNPPGQESPPHRPQPPFTSSTWRETGATPSPRDAQRNPPSLPSLPPSSPETATTSRGTGQRAPAPLQRAHSSCLVAAPSPGNAPPAHQLPLN